MRVASYARVSSESQEARGTIGSQLEALREKLSELGHEIVQEYRDDGYSGARLDRPGLDALRDAAELGLFEQVWCLTPDRLARSYAYQILITDELARHEVQKEEPGPVEKSFRPYDPNQVLLGPGLRTAPGSAK
jgi:site-specific DNA recombinase